MRPWGLLDRFQHPWKLLPHQMRGHSQYHLHPQGLRVSWTSDQFDVPTNSQAAVEFGGRQNNGCPGSQQVAYPGFPNERKACTRCVDALVLGVHYRQHKARVEIGTRQLHNHTSISKLLLKHQSLGHHTHSTAHAFCMTVLFWFGLHHILWSCFQLANTVTNG